MLDTKSAHAPRMVPAGKTLIQFLVALASCGLGLVATLPARGGDPPLPVRVSSGPEVSPLQLLPLRQVRIDDRFWVPKLRICKERSIPHSWQYVEGEIRAVRRAAGEAVAGEPNGTWGEANLYKVLETVAYAWPCSPTRNWNGEWTRSSCGGRGPTAGRLRPCLCHQQRKAAVGPGFLDGSMTATCWVT